MFAPIHDASLLIAQAGLDAPRLATIAAVVFACAVMRGLTGFGFAIGAVPLLSLVVDPRLAVAISVVLPVPSGLMDARRAWAEAHRASMAGLLAGAALGTPVGMMLLKTTPADIQRIVVALAAILALLAVWRLKNPSGLGPLSRPWPAGIASGLLNGAAGMPGPPVVAYMLTTPMTPQMSRASLIVFFLGTGLAATATGVAVGVITVQSALVSAACLIPFVAGNRLGGWLFLRSLPGAYRGASLAILFVGAVTAAAKGVMGFL